VVAAAERIEKTLEKRETASGCVPPPNLGDRF
jgi:hypothetical protein